MNNSADDKETILEAFVQAKSELAARGIREASQSFRLIQMLFHPQPSVRMQLTERSDISFEILMQLTRDNSVDVRYSLAENHNIDEEVLLQLMEDDNPYVQLRARTTFLRVRKEKMACNNLEAKAALSAPTRSMIYQCIKSATPKVSNSYQRVAFG